MRARTAFLLALLYLGVIAYLISYAPHVKAGDEWTADQRTQALALAALHVGNWSQYRAMAHDGAAPEGRKAIPRQPGQAYIAAYTPPAPESGSGTAGADMAALNRQFLLSAALGWAVLELLPAPYRDQALKAGVAIEASVMANHLRMGIGFRF